MNRTEAKTFDLTALERRITVSDEELAAMLGVGRGTARKIAEDAHAVTRAKLWQRDIYFRNGLFLSGHGISGGN